MFTSLHDLQEGHPDRLDPHPHPGDFPRHPAQVGVGQCPRPALGRAYQAGDRQGRRIVPPLLGSQRRRARPDRARPSRRAPIGPFGDLQSGLAAISELRDLVADNRLAAISRRRPRTSKSRLFGVARLDGAPRQRTATAPRPRSISTRQPIRSRICVSKSTPFWPRKCAWTTSEWRDLRAQGLALPGLGRRRWCDDLRSPWCWQSSFSIGSSGGWTSCAKTRAGLPKAKRSTSRSPASDELAQVDQAFREMAASLEEQKAGKRDVRLQRLARPAVAAHQSSRASARSSSIQLAISRASSSARACPPTCEKQGRKLIKQNIAESIHYIQAAVERLAADHRRPAAALTRGQGPVPVADARPGARLWPESSMPCTTASAKKKPRSSCNPLPDACGDPTAVEQIFANLLGNAVKYLEPRAARSDRGRDASTRPPEATERFSCLLCQRQRAGHSRGVSRAGVHGLQPAARRTSLQAKASAWPSSAAWSSGTGGSIWIESAPGVGSTFFTALAVAIARCRPGTGNTISARRKLMRRMDTKWPQNRS